MPLPTDEHVLKTSTAIIEQFQGIFGKHPGKRPAHAKGIIVTGTFTPTAEAGQLSKAPHFNSASTPVWARFSNSTGIPNIPDNDHNADPRGFGLRFQFGNHKHTDIITHSTPFFPVSTAEQFLEFLKAIAASGPDSPHPTPVEQFVGGHPSTLAFVQAPKPAPVSYATEQYWSVSAFKLVSAAGKTTFVRWQFVPDAGVQPLEASTVDGQDADYLQKELPRRLEAGPVGFKLVAQIAEEGDNTTDATVHWPASRKVVEIGTVKLNAVLPDYEKEAKYMILDPIPRIDGVEASDDPLLEMRAAIYIISGKQRRAA